MKKKTMVLKNTFDHNRIEGIFRAYCGSKNISSLLWQTQQAQNIFQDFCLFSAKLACFPYFFADFFTVFLEKSEKTSKKSAIYGILGVL